MHNTESFMTAFVFCHLDLFSIKMVLSPSCQLGNRSLNLTLHFTQPSHPQPRPGTQVFPCACHVQLQPSLMLNPTRQSAPCAFRCWGGASVRRLTVASSHCRYDVVTLGAPTCPCHQPDVTMVPATGAACRVTCGWHLLTCWKMPTWQDYCMPCLWMLLPVTRQTAMCCLRLQRIDWCDVCDAGLCSFWELLSVGATGSSQRLMLTRSDQTCVLFSVVSSWMC